MRNRLIFSAGAVVAMLALSPAPRSQGAAQPGSAPDLSGVWLVEKFQPVLFPNGGAPLQPWAEAKLKATNPQTDDPNLACLPEGVPRYMISVPYPMEIFQGSASVLIIHEGTSVLRQIHMSRQHPKDLDPTYAGDSVGKWEGDTLVVDTIGFNDKTWLDGGAIPHTEALHVVERIRRIDHDTLVDEFTIDDAKAYTKPITARQVYKLKPDWEVHEYVCEENNKYTYQGK
ncbi:MAG TPA: hypothetical protein VN976_11445 [Verrucomicrobiae bacterium]|nr:hypothetical protein [Verrucomicrobiae bacterium]